MNEFRSEQDLLGEVAVPANALYGAHTARALDNFDLAGRPLQGELVHAYGVVKLACALTNRGLGVWADDPQKADAIEAACRELADGRLDEHVVVDLLQGGAGTSTNMNVNEVIANRALEIVGAEKDAIEDRQPAGARARATTPASSRAARRARASLRARPAARPSAARPAPGIPARSNVPADGCG